MPRQDRSVEGESILAGIKAIVVPTAASEFAVVAIDLPQPGSNAVRVLIETCEICHTDKFVKEGGLSDSTGTLGRPVCRWGCYWSADSAATLYCSALPSGSSNFFPTATDEGNDPRLTTRSRQLASAVSFY